MKEDAKMKRGKFLVKVLACLFLLPLSASFVLAQPAPVEKTGQTTKYATGDDGDYEKGVAWPNPRFTDNGDQTVTDNLTGLMWAKNANLFGTKTWAEAINACEILELGANGCNLYTDWRLPNRRELFSLIHDGFYDPAVPNTAGTGEWTDGDPFDNVRLNPYWSSTTLAGTEPMASVVYTEGNIAVAAHYKDANLFGEKNWADAITTCENLEWGANGCNIYTDWRLPNSNELASLLDKSNYDPALPNGHPFNNVQSYYYWSSTTLASNSANAWFVNVFNGVVNGGNKASIRYVWPVRGGR
jgi:hypothetical protein